MNLCRRLTGSTFLILAVELFMSPFMVLAQSALSLRIGESLPDVVGHNLTGNPAHLSTTVADKVAVVVFSFSKAGGKDTRLWNQQLLTDFGSNHSIALSTVIMLESAPRLLHGVIVSGIKNDMPPSLDISTIVSYKNEKLWKQRLGVADDSRAYIVVLGQDGDIRWMSSGAMSDAEYKELKTTIQQQFRSANPR